MITTIFEDKFLEGKAVGIVEGVAIGEARSEGKWKAEGEAKSIATVLETRFGKVPIRIVKSINSYSDPNVLESWTRQAVTCKSLKEFEKVLK